MRALPAHAGKPLCYTELSPSMPLEGDMKKNEHLWQNRSPNFLAEKAFNAAVANLDPYCAVCSLFCPYTKVGPTATTRQGSMQYTTARPGAA